MHLSDLHLRSDRHWLYHGVHPWERLTDVLVGVDPDCLSAQGLPRAPFDLTVITGDITHDEGAAVYEELAAELATLQSPVLIVPGNHDDPAAFLAAFGGRTQVGFIREQQLGSWRVIGLNSQVPGEVAGRLGESQLNWLDERLQAERDRPTLIALHHAPVSVGTPWLDRQQLEDGGAFMACLGRHPQVRGVLFGHVHQEYAGRTEDGVWLLAAPAVSIQFKSGSSLFAVDPSPPGVRWIELCADGRLRSEVWWLEGRGPNRADLTWSEGENS
nr:phosphodiesterase [Halorhodospira abdelmalekii]